MTTDKTLREKLIEYLGRHEPDNPESVLSARALIDPRAFGTDHETLQAAIDDLIYDGTVVRGYVKHHAERMIGLKDLVTRYLEDRGRGYEALTSDAA
jgi:hypothetical protein